MSLKEFWKLNKYDYMWTCIAFTLAALLMGAIKHYEPTTTGYVILSSYPLIFLMGFGISSTYKK